MGCLFVIILKLAFSHLCVMETKWLGILSNTLQTVVRSWNFLNKEGTIFSKSYQSQIFTTLSIEHLAWPSILPNIQGMSHQRGIVDICPKVFPRINNISRPDLKGVCSRVSSWPSQYRTQNDVNWKLHLPLWASKAEILD